MLTVVAVLLPVVLVVALGAWMRQRDWVDPPFVAGLNRLIFRVFLPALLVHKLAAVDPGDIGAPTLRLVAVMAATLVVSALVMAAVAWCAGWNRQRGAAVVQAAFRVNLAFVGWPILAFAMSSGSTATGIVVPAIAVAATAPMVAIYNMVAVVLFTATGSATGMDGRPQRPSILRPLLTNPLIIAAVVGFALACWSPTLPSGLRQLVAAGDRALTVLGDAALALALVGVGASLEFDRLKRAAAAPVLAAVVRVALGPLIAWPLALLFGLEGESLTIALLLMACPTAVSTWVVAANMNGDAETTADAICISTLLALPAIAVVLLLV